MFPSSALALFLLPLLCAGDPIHVPLKRSPRARTVQDCFAAADRARARYGYARSSNAPKRHLQRGTSSQDFTITDQQADTAYFSTVSIGTPPQAFNVLLDTGSADLWVLNSACTQCNGTGSKFDSSKSSTFSQSSGQSPTTMTYALGSVQGTIASDTVAMGSFFVSNQGFLVAENMTSGLVDGDVSGLIGLAFQPLAETKAVPFWQVLISNNQLGSPEMSFHLARSTSKSDSPGGTFTLGGTNTTLFSGSIDFQDVQGPSTPLFWLLEVSAVTAQGSLVNISTGNAALAAIDTGSTLIGGPSTDVAAIWAKVPGASALQTQSGFFGFPCSTSVNITMAFGGQTWSINSEDMNLGQVEAGSSTCIGAIFDLTLSADTSTGTPSWVVGNTFLKNVYTVFRQNPMSVGFAQLSTNAGGTGTSAGSTSSPSSPTSGSSNNSPSPSSTGTSAAEGSTSAVSSVIAKKSSNARLIGGLVAAIVVILALAGAFLFLLRRRRRQTRDQTSVDPLPPPPPMTGVPDSMRALYGAAYAEPDAPEKTPSTVPSGQSPSPSPLTSPYAASGSAAPSSSGHGPFVVSDSGVGGSGSYGDLQRRQQEIVASYERGLGGRDPPIREVDSGLRGGLLVLQRTGGTEPPVYTPD